MASGILTAAFASTTRSRRVAAVKGHREDAVAFLQRRDAGADRLDDARNLAARRERTGRAELVHVADDERVGEIDARRLDRDANLARRRVQASAARSVSAFRARRARRSSSISSESCCLGLRKAAILRMVARSTTAKGRIRQPEGLMRIISAALAAAMLASCATAAKVTLKDRFQSIGLSADMADCMVDDLDDRLSDDDLRDLARYTVGRRAPTRRSKPSTPPQDRQSARRRRHRQAASAASPGSAVDGYEARRKRPPATSAATTVAKAAPRYR